MREVEPIVLPTLQALVALAAMALATLVGIRGIVPGDALIGLYSATVGYVFGAETYRRGVVRGQNGGTIPSRADR